MSTLTQDYINHLQEQRNYFYNLKRYDIVSRIEKQIDEAMSLSITIKCEKL
jgi:hypothetical protein